MFVDCMMHNSDLFSLLFFGPLQSLMCFCLFWFAYTRYTLYTWCVWPLQNVPKSVEQVDNWQKSSRHFLDGNAVHQDCWPSSMPVVRWWPRRGSFGSLGLDFKPVSPVSHRQRIIHGGSLVQRRTGLDQSSFSFIRSYQQCLSAKC